MNVVVIGCGVVGATIAYELTQVPGLTVTVVDRHQPAQASTGAALGVLMGAISQKVKGRAWKRRETSIQRYETLIPELEAATGRSIPFNRQGILMLCLTAADLPKWEALAQTRHGQGWPLELWERDTVQARCPQIQHPNLVAAIYSAGDRQVDPTALTLALVAAAKQRGATFYFNDEVTALGGDTQPAPLHTCRQVITASQELAADWVVVAAGLGSTALAQPTDPSLKLHPVLGQALRLQLEQPLGNPHFQPVITGDDIHIVPLGQADYWIGATVEFPSDAGEVTASADRLDQVLEGAIALCPALANARLLHTWSGLRPRPQGRPAPIIEPLAGYHNVLLATGHYRNGVLLAPATAQAVRAAIERQSG
ncbi:FAD-binding oxidoreductase [Oculatella sp. LEGE 06141]|uniref:NAD(P)/FAD-dependent oxidoreductase n=1 Tax=Oculatella sp. LEGE 06141 TaxID=1828648 RepID=UPI0018805073|nr:FAD-dependent oxidoreductase [Oculatella sp. LEGE 06141]MBE9181018.1 FAD-binding oxidoreductase [Oculatella sp. LEGE 06141]